MQFPALLTLRFVPVFLKGDMRFGPKSWVMQEKRIWRAKEVQSSGACSLKVLFMGENEHRYVCSMCSIHICLYGLFRAIRSWSGGCEGTGIRVRLVGCNVSVRDLNIEDIPA